MRGGGAVAGSEAGRRAAVSDGGGARFGSGRGGHGPPVCHRQGRGPGEGAGGVGKPDAHAGGEGRRGGQPGTGQAAGGLIGALVVAAIEGAETSSRVGNLEELMAPLNFDHEAEFESMLQSKLAEAGYGDVKLVGESRKKMAPLTKKTMPETTADAVLDVSMVSFGVQKAVTGEEWRPAAGVKVQLLNAADSSILMENMISYNRPCKITVNYDYYTHPYCSAHGLEQIG